MIPGPCPSLEEQRHDRSRLHWLLCEPNSNVRLKDVPERGAAFVAACERSLMASWREPKRAFIRRSSSGLTEQQKADARATLKSPTFASFRNAFVDSQKETPFHCMRRPQIAIGDFMGRIDRYMKCSVECFPIALSLVDRFFTLSGGCMTDSNAYRLWSVALCVAAKSRDDDFYTNTYYSQVAGISAVEFGNLEVYFCGALGWDLYVPPSEYLVWESHLLGLMAEDLIGRQTPSALADVALLSTMMQRSSVRAPAATFCGSPPRSQQVPRANAAQFSQSASPLPQMEASGVPDRSVSPQHCQQQQQLGGGGVAGQMLARMPPRNQSEQSLASSVGYFDDHHAVSPAVPSHATFSKAPLSLPAISSGGAALHAMR